MYFEKGEPNGEAKYWYDNDQLLYDAVYDNGIPERMKGWRENGDPWFHYEFKGKNKVDKTWNIKGELLDPESFETGQELKEFEKMMEEMAKDNIWVISL